jgi:hypothetical protein
VDTSGTPTRPRTFLEQSFNFLRGFSALIHPSQSCLGTRCHRKPRFTTTHLAEVITSPVTYHPRLRGMGAVGGTSTLHARVHVQYSTSTSKKGWPRCTTVPPHLLLYLRPLGRQLQSLHREYRDTVAMYNSTLPYSWILSTVHPHAAPSKILLQSFAPPPIRQSLAKVPHTNRVPSRAVHPFTVDQHTHLTLPLLWFDISTPHLRHVPHDLTAPELHLLCPPDLPHCGGTIQ